MGKSSGWVASKPVFVPSKEAKKDPKTEQLKKNPELLERLLRHTLGSQARI